MESAPLRSVVIVGGGSAGWMTAAALARVFGAGLSVTLVESEEIGIVGVGEATIPPIARFNDMLRIDEDAFVRETQATFKLGIEFHGWGAREGAYMHSFSNPGQDLGYIPFHHYWRLDQEEGAPHALWDYDRNTRAAHGGRFARGLMHAYHFDAALYAAFLRRYAEDKGVTRVEGKVVEPMLEGERGDLRAVRLEDGREIGGDLFIDCSGFRALLIGQALGVAYENWSALLPCDRALAAGCARVAAPAPYTRATAVEAGWRWRIPLRHRTGNGIVYASAFLSDERAEALLLEGLDGAAIGTPRPIRFVTGRRAAFWRNNCVAIGLSAGFLEPLESTSLHLIQSSIERLIMLFPRAGDNARLRAEFNASAAEEMEHIRDFIILHYHANGREGEAFWDHCRSMAIPDSLAHKIELFREAGAIHAPPADVFRLPSWLQVLIGQGVTPQSVHPFARRIAAADRRRFLDGLRDAVGAEVEKLPRHADELERIAGGGAS